MITLGGRICLRLGLLAFVFLRGGDMFLFLLKKGLKVQDSSEEKSELRREKIEKGRG